MSDTFQPCEVEDERFVRPCSSLRKALGRPLELVQWFNFKLGKPSRSFVLLKSGAFSKEGVVLNRCPFCGENIGDHMGKTETIK